MSTKERYVAAIKVVMVWLSWLPDRLQSPLQHCFVGET